MGKKKIKYKAPKVSKKEIEDFKKHTALINEKSKEISEKYKEWWDSKNKTWKKEFKGHGTA